MSEAEASTAALHQKMVDEGFTHAEVAQENPVTEWHYEHEFFDCNNWRWDILEAKKFARSRKTVRVAVDEFANVLDLESLDANFLRYGSNRICDLNHPVIVCGLSSAGAAFFGHPRILIDGWHRVALASRTGVLTLPAVVLTANDGLSISYHNACYGCDHHSHVQFDPDDWDECSHFCDPCLKEINES